MKFICELCGYKVGCVGNNELYWIKRKRLDHYYNNHKNPISKLMIRVMRVLRNE